jgi:hypothetical protein
MTTIGRLQMAITQPMPKLIYRQRSRRTAHCPGCLTCRRKTISSFSDNYDCYLYDGGIPIDTADFGIEPAGEKMAVMNTVHIAWFSVFRTLLSASENTLMSRPIAGPVNVFTNR